MQSEVFPRPFNARELLCSVHARRVSGILQITVAKLSIFRKVLSTLLTLSLKKQSNPEQIRNKHIKIRIYAIYLITNILFKT